MHLIFILILILWYLLCGEESVEGFQYLYRGGLTRAVEEIPGLTDENVILETPVTNHYECSRLCQTTPQCNGFNYALENCTLYKKIKYQEPEIKFYAYW